MSTLNALTIRGASPQLARLLDALDRTLSGGWRRDTEAEARLQGLGLPGGNTLCFSCTSEGRRPAAAIWLERRGGEELRVTNIVPLGKHALSEDEHNMILAEFESQVLASDDLGIETEQIISRVTPEVYLSREAARRLKAFSDMADKSSPDSADCQRWHEFIVQSHLEGADFYPSLLDQWLGEQGWPEDERQHLVCEYETARSILGAYDEERLERCLP